MKRIVTWLIVFLFALFVIAVLLPFFAKTKGGPNDSAKHFTQHDIRILANAFQFSQGNNKTNDTIHTLANGLFFSCGFQFQSNLISNLWLNNLTNENGELLDTYETPYQVEIISRTNFIIRSAGYDRKFGDADDIIFNSISNGFVKP